MKPLAALVSFALGTSMAADSGDALAEPKSVLKIVTAIESSNIDRLTSKKDEQGTSYHLRRAEFLGTVSRGGKTFTIAHAVFVRSSPPGRDTPPPRGYDFIVVFGPDFKICGVGRTTFGDYYMKGEKLYFGKNDDKKALCADFGCTKALTRYRGFHKIGLDYPFPDRITETEWESGAFLKDISNEDKKSGLYPVQQ
jgi:hypothetical protein